MIIIKNKLPKVIICTTYQKQYQNSDGRMQNKAVLWKYFSTQTKTGPCSFTQYTYDFLKPRTSIKEIAGLGPS